MSRQGTCCCQEGALGAPLTLPSNFQQIPCTVADDIVAHLGALIEAAQAGLLYGRDMDEHVLATTAVRLDETITFFTN